jgi:pimeloyl-ACP methyl ester carboxylesterase
MHVASVDFAFLHGGGQAGWVWEETLAALTRQGADNLRRAIAFDLPGCGALRGQDVSGLSVRQVAEHFVADLAASGLEDVVLVGHSNAGTILPIVAELMPGRLRQLIYLSCIAPPSGQSVLELMSARHDFTVNDDMATRWRTMFCNDMSEPQAAAFLARLGEDRWPTAAALAERSWRYDHLAQVPATYLLCLRDQVVPMAWQEGFAERLQVRQRVYIDAGHQAMNTRPQALAEMLLHEALRERVVRE